MIGQRVCEHVDKPGGPATWWGCTYRASEEVEGRWYCGVHNPRRREERRQRRLARTEARREQAAVIHAHAERCARALKGMDPDKVAELVKENERLRDQAHAMWEYIEASEHWLDCDECACPDNLEWRCRRCMFNDLMTIRRGIVAGDAH